MPLLDRLAMAAVAIIGVPLVMVAYVALVEQFVGRLDFKSRSRVRPWLWAGPALLLLILYLIYPTLNTVYLSLLNYDSTLFVGLDNYVFVLTSSQTLDAVKNNVLWLILLTSLTVTLGLLMAVLFDKVRYEAAAKAVVFIPMAISSSLPASFGSSCTIISHREFRKRARSMPSPPGWVRCPYRGSSTERRITRRLIWVGVWMWDGFAMVILSAGLKGIPVEGHRSRASRRSYRAPSSAARDHTDAGFYHCRCGDDHDHFRAESVRCRVRHDQRQFRYGRDGDLMYKYMFNFTDFGVSSAIAVILLLAIIPVMLVNISAFSSRRRYDEHNLCTSVKDQASCCSGTDQLYDVATSRASSCAHWCHHGERHMDHSHRCAVDQFVPAGEPRRDYRWWTAFSPPLQFTLDLYQQAIGRAGMGQSFVNSLFIASLLQ